jgi:hypothetical protein
MQVYGPAAAAAYTLHARDQSIINGPVFQV